MPPNDAPPGIEPGPINDWFVDNIAGAAPPFVFSRVAGGNSNLTYRVESGDGRTFALRRPPLGHVLESAHDMVREFRIIDALRGTVVPVPAAVRLCTDRTVLGVDFYVMQFVDGLVPHDADASVAILDADRVPLSEHVADVLAGLHLLDVDEVGLGDLGKREDYVARQLRRWSRQWDESKQREIPAMEEVRTRLELRVPRQRRSTIVHGDYRLGNMIVGSGRVLAVLDWELGTLGDPMADLGYLLNNWLAPEEPVVWRSSPTQAGGFLDRDAIVERYAAATGADMADVAYYEAFQSWRLAAILEGVYARYVHGAMASTAGVDLDEMADAVIRLAESALARL